MCKISMNSYAQGINLRKGKREGSSLAKNKIQLINVEKIINYHFKITTVITIIIV